MTTLKEETIKGIQAEGKFDMSNFGEFTDLKKRSNMCGTACCIAGHIVAAAARLGRELPKVRDCEERYDRKTDRYKISKLAENLEQKGIESEDSPVPDAARLVWARAYGKESANALDFYARGEDFSNPGFTLSNVPPEEAIAHLERVAKIK